MSNPGWGGGVFFSDLVSTPTKCAAFAQSIKAFMVKYSFDGVDLGKSLFHSGEAR